MKCHSQLSMSLIMSVFLLSASAQANRTFVGSIVDAAVPVPSGVTEPCPDGIEDIDHCPATGCGDLGDAELNKAKNSETMSGSPVDMSIASIKALSQPNKFDTGQDRTNLKPNEGKAVRVMGFLLVVKAEGGESCNCGLTRRAQTDVHLALGEDAEDLEEDSITAEITPRVRQHQNHDPKWQFKNVNDIEGEFVRVTGPLMLDTKHIPQAHRLPGERPNKGLKRATNWEVHPIFKLEVCVSSVPACKANKPNAWQDFK